MLDDAPADGLQVPGPGYRPDVELGLAVFGVGRASLGWLGLTVAFLVIGVLPHV